MGASHSRVPAGIAVWGLIVGAMLCPFSIGQAETVSYEYDALGRLIRVERSDGTQTIYDLDPAGNRTQVREGATPNQPASLTVPSSSTSGSYVISWTAPTSGTVDVYELYESTSSSFSSQTRIYSGTGLSKTVSGKGTERTTTECVLAASLAGDIELERMERQSRSLPQYRVRSRFPQRAIPGPTL